MSPNCEECPWDSCRKSICIAEEGTKSSGTSPVGFFRTFSDVSDLNNIFTGPDPTTDGFVYKRRKLRGRSVVLQAEENVISRNVVNGTSLSSDNHLFTWKEEITGLAPLSCLDCCPRVVLQNGNPLISGQNCVLKPAAALSSQLEPSPKCPQKNICYTRKSKAPQHHFPDTSMREERVPLRESAGNLNKSVVQHDTNVNGTCSSSEFDMEYSSTSMNRKTEVEDSGDCTSSNVVSKRFTEFTSARELCISVLKCHGLLGGGLVPSASKEVVSFDDASPSQSCKTCGQLENPLKMLICDLCEEAFHLSCCNLRVGELPVDEWYCQTCFRKKPKPFMQNAAEKSFNAEDSKFEKKKRKYTVSSILKDTEPYTTGVRIGRDFQAEVPDWSGPLPNDHDYFGDPLELSPAVWIGPNGWDGNMSIKRKSIGNWIQCRQMIRTSKNGGIVCGKWRRAPFFVVQTDDWDCSCALTWDPVYADCSVPQELETKEVLMHLRCVGMLKPRFGREDD